MTRLIKHLAIIFAIGATGMLCVASPPAVLDRGEAVQLATNYAHKQKWDVITVWKDARFNDKTREWQVFIQTKQNGGPMIVYVSDDTKKVRHARGE